MNKSSIIIYVLFSFLLLSCKGEKSTEGPDNVLDVAMLKEPAMLNPVINPGATERIVFHNIFTPMADFHPETYENCRASLADFFDIV